MADKTQFGMQQFGSAGPVRSAVGAGCAQCEAMLTDLLDGTLSEQDLAAFELHRASCTACDQMLSDAKRGAAMLARLRVDRPEPRVGMVDRILQATSGAAAASPAVTGLSIPALPLAAMSGAALPGTPASSDGAVRQPFALGDVAVSPAASHEKGRLLAFRPTAPAMQGAGWSAVNISLRRMTLTMVQPRLAMTAAMAFFSIALTLNLTGVRLSALKASDLRPAAIERSFYQANAHVVRYYENLRVVYELESRVRDLQRANDGANDGSGSGSGSGSMSAEPEPTSTTPAQTAPTDGSSAKPSARPAPATRPSSGTSQRQSLVQPVYRLTRLEPGRSRSACKPARTSAAVLTTSQEPTAVRVASLATSTGITSQEGALV